MMRKYSFGVARNMSGFLAILFFLTPIIHTTVSDAQSVKSDVVGHWISADRSKGGIGSMWDFKSDGSLTMSPGTLVDMPYQISGDKLILPPGTTHADAKPQVFSFRVDGNILYELPDESALSQPGKDQLKKEIKFTRVTAAKPGDPPIVGTWKIAFEEGAVPSAAPPASSEQRGREIILHNTVHTYTKDGVLKLRIPFAFIPGTYNVADSKSGAFSISASPGRVFKYRLADGKLYLTQPDGKTEDVYAREDNE
jgi:hypothetical protein